MGWFLTHNLITHLICGYSFQFKYSVSGQNAKKEIPLTNYPFKNILIFTATQYSKIFLSKHK